MNSLAVFVFALVLAAANAGYIAHSVVPGVSHGGALQGPSSRTTVVGPDGSHIEAVAPGGRVETASDVGYAALSLPTVYAHAPAVYSAPVLATAYHAPSVYSGYPLLAPGSGIEGQYVHDYTERLYDDGSYKGEYYH